MTKEEAIMVLKNEQPHCGKKALFPEEKKYEAYDVAIKALEQELCDDMGEVSDGYHTFNQLYHQRAVLFATIVNQNKDKSWKSFKHSDGNYCFDSNGEWFIVGIDTPNGSYTYHYSKEYWNMFDCEELECGKEWDGHTEKDVTRLLSLEQEPCDDAISRQAVLEKAVYTETEEGWWGYTVDVEYIKSLPSITSKPETVTEFADRCHECGAKYGKLLKQDSCEDAISRQAAIDACLSGWNKDYKEIVEEIRTLPPVTPQPKTGRWIRTTDKAEHLVWDCDKCSWQQRFNTNYCPNCGAKMEGDKR